MKTAVTYLGVPNKGENEKRFYDVFRGNLKIMSDVFDSQGYKVVESNQENLIKDLKKYSSEEDFAFYYSGHGKSGQNVGPFKTSEILENISKRDNKKYLIFDSCSGNSFDLMDGNSPKNSNILYADEVPYNKTIAKFMWDLVIARKGSLEGITQNSFDSIKQNWIKVLKTK